MEKIKTILIPEEYKPLFGNDWREAGVYGGRYCFTGETIVSMDKGSFKRIDDIKVGDKVLSLVGECDIVINVDKFNGQFDPKPMFTLIINGVRTNTTYDHKYFNGSTYVPVYQLVWGIMDESQRRTLKLLCEQYGENTKHEIQRWIQNTDIETSNEQEWIFNDSSRKKNTINPQIDSENIYTEHGKQENSQPQERNKDRQQNRKFGVGDKERTVRTPLENRVKNGCLQDGKQLQKNDRGTSERIITISLGQSNNADKDDVKISSKENWDELRWDTGFAKWKNLEISSRGIPIQENDNLGGKKSRIRVARVYKSIDVWSISTEKYHNYFANGVNVSNSLKSHTVARYLLIRAREKKTRVACFREFQASIAESSHQLLSELIVLYELIDFEVTNNAILNKVNGSDFLFKGLWNNEQSIKSIEGIDIAWVEEAQTVSKKSLEVLTPTVRKPNSKIIYTYNRLLEEDPVHNRLVLEGRPDTLIINENYDIAIKYKMMPDVILKEIEDDKKNRPKLYKHKWLGEPYTTNIKIYKDWNIVDEIPHEARLERRGIDFGFTNDPTAIIDIYKYNDGYILDEQIYRTGMLNRDIADFILNLPECLNVADSAEPKSIEEVKQRGVNIVGAKKHKMRSFGSLIPETGSKESYVKWSIGIVQEQRISMTKSSTNLIKAYRNYLWQTDKDGKILNVPDHYLSDCMDATRYAVISLAPVIRTQNIVRQIPIYQSNTNKTNPWR